MKKLLIITTLFLLTANTYAISINPTDDVKGISYTALRLFEDEFKAAKKVSWKTYSEYVKASFVYEGKHMAALYDLQGNFIGAVEYKMYDNLPVEARIAIEKRFKGYTFDSALRIASRPEPVNSFDTTDVGTYWVVLKNDIKQVYINVSPSLAVTLHKSISLETTASR